ncbi:MAG: DUF3135 domain-containing protein [Gammaproteobacteria bacterium]|nr:DUF3135 domain-containing protein [Gammaproteobacteria bacterium]NND38015.1 DUF3135 domain-containing protein [Pseudomonadales bacterium]NNL11650.1 DUF3135 domain-containing protein [Pseudomonadales bacterium]NNM12283.1 DUF3135 domain-containing protein [Pseudomonadales bacterium]RZV55086.1 MAG: DUF3135 domain-containing protein [Pseudomonadales bacterium]
MSNENNKETNSKSQDAMVYDELGKPTLPDFDTLRDIARNNPAGLERLRIALCQKVIEEAPEHSRARLEGLMFQINARRQLAKTDLEACEDLSQMMNASLKRMQAMLKDLRTIQSESILLSTRNYLGEHSPTEDAEVAAVIPFKRKFKRNR